MSDVNRVIISGRLTKDAIVKNLSSGTTVVEFGFASNRKFKGIRVFAWRFFYRIQNIADFGFIDFF